MELLFFRIILVLYLNIKEFFLFLYLQFLNTRSHKDKGEREKAPDQDSSSDVDEANLSLMDRTKRQAKAARDHAAKRAAEPILEEEVLGLEEVVLQTRQRVKAAKAAKARATALRQELLQLQEEEESIAADNDSAIPAPATAPVPDVSDPGAFVAASLTSAVNIYFFIAIFGIYSILGQVLISQRNLQICS